MTATRAYDEGSPECRAFSEAQAWQQMGLTPLEGLWQGPIAAHDPTFRVQWSVIVDRWFRPTVEVIHPWGGRSRYALVEPVAGDCGVE